VKKKVSNKDRLLLDIIETEIELDDDEINVQLIKDCIDSLDPEDDMDIDISIELLQKWLNDKSI